MNNLFPYWPTSRQCLPPVAGLCGSDENTAGQAGSGTHRPGFRAALVSTIIAAVFCSVVCGILAAAYFARSYGDPLKSQQYAALKQQLFQKGGEGGGDQSIGDEKSIGQARQKREELKKNIQELDLQLRNEYFRQRRFAAVGGFLLLVGFVVFLIAARTAAALRPWIPQPEPGKVAVDPEPNTNRIARWATAVLTLFFVLSCILLAALFPAVRPGDFPASLRDAAGLSASAEQEYPATRADKQPVAPVLQPLAPVPPVALPEPPSAAEIAKNWPRFRGPGGLGVSAYDNLPTEWDAESEKSILWKTPVPLPGNNSPVVWGKRVFLSGATADRREIYCFDADKGKLLWTRQVEPTPQSAGKKPKVLEDTGFAAPTIAVDGRCLVAMFANGDAACTDLDGKILWTVGLGVPESSYGHASSPLIYKNLVIIQFDQASAGDGKSKLLALDLTTGKIAWQQPRKVPNSWATPIAIDHAGREQLITAADPWVIAYSPHDGKELWRAECLSGDHGISPVFAGGLVQVGNEYCQWNAIRADGSGDVTKTHIAWQAEDGLPDTVSPVGNDEFVFIATSFGMLTCYDVKNGKMLWEEDFETEITSSPSLVGKRLYLFSKTDEGWVVKPTREGCKRVAENKLGEPCVTSPALQDGRFYIRGQKNLFCIGEKK